MTLALKLLLAPALVVLSSLAGRRWGPHVTGLLVALPVVAGPILLITELQHGRQFGAHAAAASLLGLTTLSAFGVVFAWTSLALGWPGGLAVSWALCLAADLGLSFVRVTPLVGLAVALGGAALAARLMPQTAPAGAGSPGWPRGDLIGRAVATAVLVTVVTGAASSLGPRLTGVLAPFPIATSVVAAFTFAQRGHPATLVLLKGMLRGLTGFATFCFLVAVLLIPAGAPLAFTAAVVGALLVQVGLQAATTHRTQPTESAAQQATGGPHNPATHEPESPSNDQLGNA